MWAEGHNRTRVVTSQVFASVDDMRFNLATFILLPTVAGHATPSPPGTRRHV